MRLVGKSVPRVDIPVKVTGSSPYVHNVRVPSMLHGRVIRPPKIGSTLARVDEGSVSGVAGLVKIVRKGNFLGVVAEREEQAIEAARLLKVEWTGGRTLPDYQDLYQTVRDARLIQTEVAANSGNVDSALANAAKVLEATYTYPLQLHGMLGPSCAVADVRDGRATIWSGSQWIQGDRRNLAKMLGIPVENVHSIWVEASGSYGRLGCDDAAADAALLSQAVGKPVRVQWMRHDEHGWEPMSPAMTMDVRAGLDAQGQITAFDFNSGRRVIREASPATSSLGASPVAIQIGIGCREGPIRRPTSFPTRECRATTSTSCSGRSIFGGLAASRAASRLNPSWTKSRPNSKRIQQSSVVTTLKMQWLCKCSTLQCKRPAGSPGHCIGRMLTSPS